MGILDRIKQAARDFMGDERSTTSADQDRTRSYAQTPPPQTTAFGTIDAQGRPASRSYTTGATPPPAGASGRSDDEIAVERYRYLLRTAPPETIEQVHAEAFARLTEPQRQQVLADLAQALPAQERPADADPATMARAATRAEYLNPGTMERTLGGGRQGPGFGSIVGGSLLGTVAGYVVGSALMSAFLAPAFAGGEDGSAGGDEASADGGGADGGTDAAADAGGFADFGGDFGGFEF